MTTISSWRNYWQFFLSSCEAFSLFPRMMCSILLWSFPLFSIRSVLFFFQYCAQVNRNFCIIFHIPLKVSSGGTTGQVSVNLWCPYAWANSLIIPIYLFFPKHLKCPWMNEWLGYLGSHTALWRINNDRISSVYL